MARHLRIEFAGAFYHVMARGNRREAIFLDDEDRHFFLKVLSQACGQTGWRVHAWVLMRNHYHLCLETPEPNLVEGMKWVQNTYTRRFNLRHGQWGRLFGDRYKSVVVEGDLPQYYGTLLDYIHLNPARSGLVKPLSGESVLDYPWSSLAGGYALPSEQRPKWLAAEYGLELLGFNDTTAGRRKLVESLDRRILEEGDQSGLVPLPEEVDARMSHLRRGWFWGGQEFREKLLCRLEGKFERPHSRAYRRTPERLAHGLEQAEQLVVDGMAASGLTEEDLATTPGSEACKVALAKLVRGRTTASLSWIANRLVMGGTANAGHYVRTRKWNLLRKQLPTDFLPFLEGHLEETSE